MNDNQSAFNSSEYDRKIKQTLPYYDEFYKQVIELVKTFHNSAIKWLDIGCGTGKMGSVALENIELEQFVFCDSSAEMIRISEEQFHRPNTAFSVCNVQNLKYTNEFDVITAIQVNHYLHIEERKAALKKWYAVLREKRGVNIWNLKSIHLIPLPAIFLPILWQYIKESGYSANINIGQRGNTPAVGSRQANLPWRLQKGSCLKKQEASNLI